MALHHRHPFADPRADVSANEFILGAVSASTGVKVANATNAVTIDALAANDAIQIGTITATDFLINGANTVGDVVFDASADQLQRGSSAFLVPCYSSAVHDTRTGPGAISLTTSYTRIVTTGADAITLAAPGTAVPPGFIKKFVLYTDGGNATVTVTGLAGANDVFTLAELGEGATLMAVNATTWVIVAEHWGDTTVGTFPTVA